MEGNSIRENTEAEVQGATASSSVIEAEFHVKWGADGATSDASYKLPFVDSSQEETTQTSERADGSESEEMEEEEEEEDEEEEEAEEGEDGNLALKKSDQNVWTCTFVPLGLRIGNLWVHNISFLIYLKCAAGICGVGRLGVGNLCF